MSFFNLLDDVLDKTVLGGYDRFGFLVRKQLWDPAALDVDLSGKSAVVTGANSGLGLVSARELLRRGARVRLVCRNASRGAAARDSILNETQDATQRGEALLDVVDMSDVHQVRELAEKIAAEKRLDILINNAGALLNERKETAAGIETTFAVGVLGYYNLTERLLPTLRATGTARVINVSSGGMYPVALNMDDPQWRTREYDGVRAYAEAKRAEVILTEIWNKQLEDSEVFVAAMHPGWADTPGVQTALPTFRAVTQLILRSPEEGADTILWLAMAKHLGRQDSGRFWCDRRARPHHRMASTRSSAADLKRFHDLCREMTGAGQEKSAAFFESLESRTK